MASYINCDLHYLLLSFSRALTYEHNQEQVEWGRDSIFCLCILLSQQVNFINNLPPKFNCKFMYVNFLTTH